MARQRKKESQRMLDEIGLTEAELETQVREGVNFITQKGQDIAEEANMNGSTLSAFLNGSRTPKPPSLIKLRNVLIKKGVRL